MGQRNNKSKQECHASLPWRTHNGFIVLFTGKSALQSCVLIHKSWTPGDEQLTDGSTATLHCLFRCPEGPCESYNFQIIPGMVSKYLQLPEPFEPLFALQTGMFEFVENNYNSKCALTYVNSRLLLL